MECVMSMLIIDVSIMVMVVSMIIWIMVRWLFLVIWWEFLIIFWVSELIILLIMMKYLVCRCDRLFWKSVVVLVCLLVFINLKNLCMVML